ncbi:MAG: alkaline phosphatase, partial [Pseudomonadota bacterium]
MPTSLRLSIALVTSGTLLALSAPGCVSDPAAVSSRTVSAVAPDLPTAQASNDWFEAGARAVRDVAAQPQRPNAARNVILFIGDGMSLDTVTAARIYAGQRAGGSGEDHRLTFESLPHTALMKTYTTDMQVPDSAGTATAMLSGVKTRTGYVGVTEAATLGRVVVCAGADRTVMELKGRPPINNERERAYMLSA